MVEQARLERSENGLAAVTPGWFVVNIREAAWMRNEAFGAACIFESLEAPYEDLGFTLHVLWPGQSAGLCHREANQEDFLVLSGECLVVIEGEERPLRAWDFVHSPPRTEHVFVGAGDGPCVIFMTGGRTRPRDTTYTRPEAAVRHGAAARAETGDRDEAYGPFPPWQPGPPDNVDELLRGSSSTAS